VTEKEGNVEDLPAPPEQDEEDSGVGSEEVPPKQDENMGNETDSETESEGVPPKQDKNMDIDMKTETESETGSEKEGGAPVPVADSLAEKLVTNGNVKVVDHVRMPSLIYIVL